MSEERVLGTISDTKVKLVTEGPKETWCADVLSKKFHRRFCRIRDEVEGQQEAD